MGTVMDIALAIWAISILIFEIFLITLPFTIVICAIIQCRKLQKDLNND